MSEAVSAPYGVPAAKIFPAVKPVADRERISAMDVARGVALLGILLMNVLLFAFPLQAIENPTAAGNATRADLWAWAATYVLVDGKMRALFSMLFGAGVILLTSREERLGQGAMADVYYRRILWLLAFGVAHAYLLLWPGDILYPYAVCGLLLYPLRKLSPRTLIVAGLLCFAVFAFKQGMRVNESRTAYAAAMVADSVAATGAELTEEQVEAQKMWQRMQQNVKPEAEAIARTGEAMRSGYTAVFFHLKPTVQAFQSIVFYRSWIWDILGMMLIGMGLFKLGVLSAERSVRFYATMAAAGYGIGLPLGIYLAQARIADDFALTESLWLSWMTGDVRRLSVALAHVAAIMLVCKSGMVPRLTSRLAAVGRMAFTNYVVHTLVCIFVFYGFGLGLFGKLERAELYWIVAGIWAFQLIASPIWLRHFRFGPLEWGWRSLAYGRRQPMRVAAPGARGTAAPLTPGAVIPAAEPTPTPRSVPATPP